MTDRYHRVETVDEEPFEDDLVVMNTRTEEVATLNGAARVVWEALREGPSFDELVALFAAAFPATDERTLRRDVAAALAGLRACGLVTVAGRDG